MWSPIDILPLVGVYGCWFCGFADLFLIKGFGFHHTSKGPVEVKTALASRSIFYGGDGLLHHNVQLKYSDLKALVIVRSFLGREINDQVFGSTTQMFGCLSYCNTIR